MQSPSHLAPPDDAARPSASVVDLFCGAGGLSHGFHLERFHLAAGVDSDEDCRYAYQRNNRAPFVRSDIRLLKADALAELFYPGVRRILVGGTPCQPFSDYARGTINEDWELVERFLSLARSVRPDVLCMENVAAIRTFEGGALFRRFVAALEEMGYHCDASIAFGPDYGLPQRRRRMVLLASRLGPIELVLPRRKATSAWEAVEHLPSIDAGAVHPTDAMHRSASLSQLNHRRIRSSRPEGTWRDWSDDLVAACHAAESGRTYPGVYGRIGLTGPAPTITTQFFGYGNGRFGHPVQDRALSLREGAILQSFPEKYVFVEPGRKVSMKRVGKMIGNAVPVLLARLIAQSIAKHLIAHP